MAQSDRREAADRHIGCEADRPGVTADMATDVAVLFADFAKAARGTGIKNRKKGDRYAESLANARADVYDMAADLVSRLPPEDAAAAMMERAKLVQVRTPPILNFDRMGLLYVQARAWQFCAWKLDPDLAEVQPRWD